MKIYRLSVLSVFLGIFLGFSSTSTVAEDYYWIGGQGFWSDLNHWQTANGATPNEVPDPTDNVIFNEDSFENPFDTVFIYTGNPTCLNFMVENLTDTVIFVGGSQTTTFSVYGSWTMHEKVRNRYRGKIKFLSEYPDNTITCSGTPFNGDVWFEGSGEWILQDTLLVIDTIPWELVVYGNLVPFGNNPTIVHVNGTLDANQQTIISRGFSTTGSLDRTFNFENSHAFIMGNWDLAATGLTFQASNSYIYIGGIMNNYSGGGEDIYYHDIDVSWPDGRLSNTDIRTHMRKVHFLGGGIVKGEKNAGQLGKFTIDTLIMEGASTAMGPIGNRIDAHHCNIHYTLFRDIYGEYEGDHGVFHRVDDSASYMPGRFVGIDNTIDSIHFFVAHKAFILGEVTINHLAYFNHIGIIDSYPTLSNYTNHLVIHGDGWILGSNTIDRLTLGSGYWYRFSSDSLNHPGSIPMYVHMQTIGQIEVAGSCTGGFTFLSSEHKETMAFINFQDNGFETEFLAVKDVHNLGETMTLSNSIDLGNNQGIDFIQSPDPRTLYWVEGGGNWGDPAHWSLESGGAGGECPPTPLDDVYFDSGSGFADSNNVVEVNIKYACSKDFVWEAVENLPAISTDTNNLRIWGSFVTNPSMQFLFLGDVYFESEDDEEYESVVIDYTLQTDTSLNSPMHLFYGQVHFWGRGGKWRLDSKYENYGDTTHLIIGELLLEDDTMSVFTFSAIDTLQKGMYMLGKTLVTLHAYGANAWNFHAYKYNKENPEISKTWWDKGLSTLRTVGNLTPPPIEANGRCNILTTGGHLDYHNIEFGDTNYIFSGFSQNYISGYEGKLISAAKCTYNLVDYYISNGMLQGWADIDTLTFNRMTKASGDVISADFCAIRNEHNINFLFAESAHDTLIMSGGRVDTAYFYNEGGMWGWHDVGYLEAYDKFSIDLHNNIDTAHLMGDTEILGKTDFSQLVLYPNHKYTFQHEWDGDYDTTKITNDWIVAGNCDAPIRLQSDSIGTQANIHYLAQNPTNVEYTADYASIKDIHLLGNEIHYATNSVDLGNNTNWEFIESGDEIFYWVGGQGRWGDWTHWALESGGEPVSEKCVPRENNTVVFDDNSFNNPNDTVYIDVWNAYCNNMYWKHTPTDFKPVFTGTDSTSLYVYGSLLLNDSMDYHFAGLLYFDELTLPNEPDTLSSKGHLFLNDIRFQGINDVVLLDGDLELFINYGFVNPPTVYLEHGALKLNGYELTTNRFYSVYKNPRVLDLTNSKFDIKVYNDRAWWVQGENLELLAENSTIVNRGDLSTLVTEGGDYLTYYDVMLEGTIDSLFNQNNTCEYNVVGINNGSNLVTGNYVADSILIRGVTSGMFGTSVTNYVVIDSMYGSVNDFHTIGKCVVNKFGFIQGENTIDYCVFFDDGVFRGTNEFDTLILFPGDGNPQNLGNWFYFESLKTQTVYDSLYIRGNQCSNITLASLDAPDLAWIQKDFGTYDVSCDYLNIMSVGAESETLTFFAGSNSTALPDPNNPPPGWVFEDAQGYIYGFDGLTAHVCEGAVYEIETSTFNGDPNTQYYWENSNQPGNSTYLATEEGTYNLRVEYNEGCYVEDSVRLITEQPPQAVLEEGPFCEGEDILVYCSPNHLSFLYEWWNGETSAMITAETDYNGTISVTITDPANNCATTLSEMIEVIPSPEPQPYLGDEYWLKFEEYITLDAGPGESWEWTSDPPVDIEDPYQRTLTVTGYDDPNPLTYRVSVVQNGCTGTASKVVGMYPPSKLGVPTAFSPNGDGDNDELKVLGTGFSQMNFRIYNRYGELVFETNDPNVGWDGNVNGKKQEMEVYTYYLHVVFEDKTEEEEKGNITLVR